MKLSRNLALNNSEPLSIWNVAGSNPDVAEVEELPLFSSNKGASFLLPNLLDNNLSKPEEAEDFKTSLYPLAKGVEDKFEKPLNLGG